MGPNGPDATILKVFKFEFERWQLVHTIAWLYSLSYHVASLYKSVLFILLCGFSVDHFALHPQKRGGLLGTGGGNGTKEWRLDRGCHPKKTGETVDHCQNNGSVKAVSPHHCSATSALHNCCFNCRAWAESQGQCPLHCCWGTTRSERSPSFAAEVPPPYSWSLLG